ncbi:MAG TPA: LysR substrate-binding domain-containing protein, partial [Thioalkalivibrio sp.]|nr:LysR substrate-binding domain-containing protein [Thioalkalivibrio sp.]
PARLGSIDATIRVDTFRLLRDIVIHSNTVGLATASQVRADEDAGLLTRLPLELPWMHSQYGFIRLRNRTPSPAALAFMSKLREVEARLAAESGTLRRSAGSDGA